jgi:hypothetical protein
VAIGGIKPTIAAPLVRGADFLAFPARVEGDEAANVRP